MTENSTAKERSWKIVESWWFSAIFLGSVVFIAHYAYFASMGLYEDDYFFAMSTSDYSLTQIIAAIRDQFATWVQGRPLGFSLGFLLSWIGIHCGGLGSMYLIGFSIVAANTILLYSIVRRAFAQSSAFFSGLIFALFPGDTTKELLTHSLALQPSLTCLLIACFFYQRNRKLLAYGWINLTLIIYESGFMPFFVVPLLLEKRSSWQDWLKHFGILLGMMAAAVIIRKSFNESRIVDTLGKPQEVLYQIFASLVIGPATSLYLCVLRPVTAIQSLHLRTPDFLMLTALLLLAALFAWCFWNQPEEKKAYGRQILLGTLMLVASYGLAFTHFPPTAMEGRLTSVHLAASVAMAILGGGLFSLILKRNAVLRLSSSLILGVYFALLLRFGLFVQGNYVQVWHQQQAFWSQLVALSPDLDAKTVVLVDNIDHTGLSQGTYIFGYTWSMPLVLERLFYFLSSHSSTMHRSFNYTQEDTPPSAYTVNESWQNLVQEKNQKLYYIDSNMFKPFNAPDNGLLLPQGNVIYLQARFDHLTRLKGTLALAGHTLRLKPLGASTITAHKRLYDYLIVPDVPESTSRAIHQAAIVIPHQISPLATRPSISLREYRSTSVTSKGSSVSREVP
jgi:hypothetical protein